MTFFEKLALVSSIILPLFNIPLIIRMIQNRSSRDISLLWVLGVVSCIWAMLPGALSSPDLAFKAMSIMNVILFSGVTATVLFFRIKKN